MGSAHQRYVSSELSHFAGKGQPEDAQYDILVNKILKSGWITHGPNHDPHSSRGLGMDLSKPISTDEALKYQVICFCDIPEGDLEIHVNKYSKFGLSFKKDFLIDRGASPVFYIANEGPVPISELFAPDDFLPRINAARARGVADRALYFDTSFRAIVDLLAGCEAMTCKDDERFLRLPIADCKSRLKSLLELDDARLAAWEASMQGNQQAAKTIKMCMYFLLDSVFTHFKCFDAKKEPDDERNYYMEREWRIGSNLNFELSDVSRVFFPKRFAKRFRADLPSYMGQITFID
jgi:abortive phage resistance protein AbiGi (putative antitoxin)